MVQILPQWKDADQLIQEVNFVIMARPGWELDWDALPPPYRKLKENVVQTPLVEISASQIRGRVRAGRPIDFLTPPTVVEYIRAHRLYV